MKKSYLFTILGILILAMTASGCVNNNQPDEAENFQLLVSDQPYDINDFRYLNVTLSKVRVFKETNQNQENATQFKEFSLNNTEVDLTKLQGEKAVTVLKTEMEYGNYTKLELYVSKAEGEANEKEANIKLPIQKLQITKPFEIKSDQTTRFVFDISVVKKGTGNDYNLLPVVSKSGVAGEDVDVEEVSET